MKQSNIPSTFDHQNIPILALQLLACLTILKVETGCFKPWTQAPLTISSHLSQLQLRRKDPLQQFQVVVPGRITWHARNCLFAKFMAPLRIILITSSYTEGLKDRRNYTNFSNRRCKFSISPTRCSDRRYSCCKSSASRGFKRFLKTDLMTIFYSSPRKNCKKPREKSIFYSLSIRGVAEVALNQCS